MKKMLASAAAVSLLALTACGNATDDAGDQAGSPDSSTTSDDNGTTFDASDYTMVVTRTCFCADRGVPVKIVVKDGKVVSATYAKSILGKKKGDPAQGYGDTTLAKMITMAKDQGNFKSDVKWPDGQDYPTKISLDPEQNMADDEITWIIKNVTVQS